MKHFLILYFLLSPHADRVLASSLSRSAPQLSEQADAFQRGLTALKDNRVENALEEFTFAEREHPDDPRGRNFRGIVLANLGQNAEAAAEYRESIRLDPRMEDAYRNLGFLKWTEHQLEPAREALARAVELSPSDSFAHYYLGRVQLEAQHYLQAIQELELSRVPLPADAGFSIQVGSGYIALGRREDARKLLDHLVTQPLNDAQSIQVASLLLAIHQNDAAINLIQRLNKRPGRADAAWLQFDLALVYLLAGSYEKAVELAHAYAESLPQAATLAPGEEEHWLNLTRELMELSRYSEAISAVQSGLAANPKSYALHLRLGAAHLSAGHYAEAESVFRDLVTAGDPLPTGYIGLAQVLLRTGRAEEAAFELTKAGQKLGPSFLISYFRGLAFDRAGKPLDAMMAFQEAVRLNSNNADVHLNLGKTELALGRVNDSIAELQKALRLSRDNAQAKRLLSQAYRRAGDSKNAAKFAEASANAPPDPEGDLLDDFFLPQLQQPPESAGQ